MASTGKQLGFRFRTWGGKRKGAGRPVTRDRRSEPHGPREALDSTSPAHITLRVVDELSGLRCSGAYHAIRAALLVVEAREDFRVVHTSIQRNHLHLLTEATDQYALAAGLHAFQISAAQRLKAHVLATSGERHFGPVFTDRYHAEIIDTPAQAHHALAYVLLNWRKHGEDRAPTARSWLLDPYSTAISFTGWAEQPAHWDLPPTYLPLPSATPQSWFLRDGWRCAGALSMFATPGKPLIGHPPRAAQQ